MLWKWQIRSDYSEDQYVTNMKETFRQHFNKETALQAYETWNKCEQVLSAVITLCECLLTM
jgi:hypothetical protein